MIILIDYHNYYFKPGVEVKSFEVASVWCNSTILNKVCICSFNSDIIFAESAESSADALEKVSQAAINNGNIFEELVNAVQHCSLGEISNALFEVGGQYRRNM